MAAGFCVVRNVRWTVVPSAGAARRFDDLTAAASRAVRILGHVVRDTCSMLSRPRSSLPATG